MSVIQGSEIIKLVGLFKSRDVKFYHACQYKDFKTYLQLGGVPSRNLMQKSGLSHTPFATDNVDKTNDVWSKVFGNLSDFGYSFAKGKRNENTAPIPNPYGPILLIFNPESFNKVIDVGICLRSAGAVDFNRDAESLSSIDDIERIFTHKIEQAPNEFAKAYIKFSRELREEFKDYRVTSPEVSCTVEKELISFQHLDEIIVDPYVIGGRSLTKKVRDFTQANKLNCSVSERTYSRGRLEIKQELANLLSQEFLTVYELIQNEQITGDLKDWANRVVRGDITWQYDRFAKYLRLGTILELQNEA